MSVTHLAAILPREGGPLALANRTTPDPGPNDVLIEVKAIALNPIDYHQRDRGFPPIPSYPAVIGCDVSGILAKVGPGVTTAPAIGTRVIAVATSYYHNGSPDYGAFQEKVLVPAEVVIPLPDDITFEDGAVIPIAAVTAMTAWTSIGIPLSARFNPHHKEQAVLVWGGASSVGSFSIQTARMLGYRVYATASPRNHEYLKTLGADAVFDYKSNDVVSQIVEAIKADGVQLRTAHCVVDGGLQPTLEILKATKGNASAKVAHSPVLPPDHPTLDDTEIVFNYPPLDEVERKKHMFECFHGWLSDGLRSGSLVPSPPAQIEKGGLGGLNEALDKLRAGVSRTKIVVRL
ncbi:chaperonin 10-like protein [Echria macrotheca]|uniref:Chaperonin 10-like protein n=1 Tax=Echria macrotheca TaxID=438768 RepID=A0AAJ0F3Z7_9PEZI|nr:chaperonin 10-like protein [Echria macrotheca]